MNDGLYIILGLIAGVNIAWIAVKVWTRKQDRAYRELYRDIWQDHYTDERKRFVRETMTDFDEPHPLMSCPDCGKFRNMDHRCDEAPTEKLQ